MVDQPDVAARQRTVARRVIGMRMAAAASIALIRDRLDFLTADDRTWLLRKTAEKVYFA